MENNETLTDQERQAFLRRRGAFNETKTAEERDAIKSRWSNDEDILYALEMGA